MRHQVGDHHQHARQGRARRGGEVEQAQEPLEQLRHQERRQHQRQRANEHAQRVAVEPIEGEPTVEYASHVFARLQEFVLKAKSDELRIRLQKLNPQTEAGYDELFHELVAVDGELRRIRQGLLDAE